MLDATFLITESGYATRELRAGDTVTSVGRALDNTICLQNDSNVSRYHAVIERRRDGFYLSDLGSSNGTTVNDEPSTIERKLKDGDRILCGGTSLIEFFQHDARAHTPHTQPSGGSSHADALGYQATSAAASAAATGLRPPHGAASPTSTAHAVLPDYAAADTSPYNAHAPASQPSAEQPSSLSPKTIAIGVGSGVALTACVALVLSGNLFGGGKCVGSARIIAPQTGTVVRHATVVRVEAENTSCIRRVRFQLNGREFAQSSIAPYDVALDPASLPRASSGNNVLTVTVENKNGERELQDGEVVIAFGANAKTPATAAPPPEASNTPAPLSSSTAGALGTSEVQSMAQRLAGQITRKGGYIFDREFADLIAARSAEYRRADAAGGARRYRREIVKAFRDRGIEPLLGFVLAFGNTKFGERGSDLWDLPPTIVANYLAPGETAAVMSDPRRSSEIAAAYTKTLMGILELENFTYAVACFGLPPDEAGEMSKRLAAAAPAERRDFWKMVKSGVVPNERVDRVTRFYAAGIVAENPQAFGATDAQPFSSFYQ